MTLVPGTCLAPISQLWRPHQGCGGHTRGELRGIKFFFNPRPLLRRHAHGFRLAVRREGTEVYAIDLADTGGAFNSLLECDRRRQ